MFTARHWSVIAGLALLSAPAWADDAPAPAEVLTKLHQSNVKEVEMGKLAQKNGQSREVKAFGKTLVTDHSAADKKVKALAKKEKVELTDEKPAMDHGDLTGADFDSKFAKSMLEDHEKDVAEMKKARDATDDPKLKALLTSIVPTLEKHEETARKLADSTKTETKTETKTRTDDTKTKAETR
jgi:putative membrane protein